LTVLSLYACEVVVSALFIPVHSHAKSLLRNDNMLSRGRTRDTREPWLLSNLFKLHM